MGLPAAISIAHTRTLFPRESVSHLLALIGRGEAARPRRSHFPMKPARNEKRQSCFASPLPRFKGGQIESACYHHRRLMSTTAEEFGMCSRVLCPHIYSAVIWFWCRKPRIQTQGISRKRLRYSNTTVWPLSLYRQRRDRQISETIIPLLLVNH